MASNPSDELNFDALDALLQQAESLDAQMRSSFPELYQGQSAEPAFAPREELSFFTGDDEPPPPAPKAALPADISEDAPVDIDEDSLQAYFLRRKFEQTPPESRWERAPAGDMVSRMGDAPAQLPDDELFLYALTKLNAGIADEASSAIALMENRPGMNPLLAFLPAYTALESGASRSRIEGLAGKRLSGGSGEASEKEMVLLSQRMLAETLQVIIESEALQEAGYKNRQEALSKAAQNVRQRLARLS